MLIKIRAADPSAATVVFTPTLSGTIVKYLEIATRLPKGLNIYGLEYEGLDLTINEQGQNYADVLNAHFKGTQLHLLGWSFGGTLAYETAAALERKGALPRCAVMLDTPLPLDENRAEPFYDLERQFVEMITGIREDGKVYPSMAAMKQTIRAHGVNTESDELDRIYLRFLRNYSKWLHYAPSTTGAQIVQLRALRPRWRGPHFDGWAEVADNMSEVPLDETHYSLATGTGAAASAMYLACPERACEQEVHGGLARGAVPSVDFRQ